MRHRIVMTRRAGTTQFMGHTEEGALIVVEFAAEQWEALGSPDEIILRIRP